ncbi:NAD(P)H-dependent oxidoreductase [Oscillatoria sp. FACHB-1407]|uniref:FMN-dependent NADH-azoreductase n=1 Tax=Oscillatoria sp. FACHB-1407 TaxID=2692847 RepID=UPI0016824082|nr:NAD(P)H-dependent oxidoreductase [Oscillatoria sp. FACHB-1407]MBD2466009.1 NAD(P)H-dependent oxidoreductase [Oscillatoria sp. FACHB-1407]
MTRLLYIASSPRHEHSYSRTLTQEFIDKWSLYHPEVSIALRDLVRDPVPYLDDTWITAKFTAPEQYTPELSNAIQLSDRLVDEFLAADRYIISVPMYNFTIPAVLKSYIDYIVRPRRTFIVENGSFKGLVTGKKLLFITARGSDFRPGSAFAPSDFQEPYLKTVFEFIGFTDIQFINANGLRTDLREQSLAEARSTIQDLATQW